MFPKLRPLAATASSLILVIALSACSAIQTAPAPTSTAAPTASVAAAMDSLDQRIAGLMADGAIAATVQVRWPGGEWSHAYGVRDLDSRSAAQPSDLVQIASVTKTMTAVAVLKLVDDHLIGLDDPVNDIIPGFKDVLHPPAPITVRELLGHTSGAPDFFDALFSNPDVRPVLAVKATPRKLFELAGRLPWDPSSIGKFSYSNTGYEALGLLVATLRHKPFAQVLREEVIDPVGLKDTTAESANLGDPRTIHGYITLRGERLDVTDNAWLAGSAAGGVTSTVADVNTFFADLFQGRLLSAESLSAMKERLSPGYTLGLWTSADGCTGGTRFEGHGEFWSYLAVAVSSADGQYVATLHVTPPALPSSVEDPKSDDQRDRMQVLMQSALTEALDRLCLRQY
ncbi:serine hydrolase domain-containing protein [Sinomonas gamaensis]|uniref:serine hydrolase domain-containing protein n=1 Tax=Sinomonas gamaensis TaxID=2565624 RepID=UPI0020166F21|nr:serine hydrolase domain-containing protein [Sinomonas gamaensis]